MKCQQFTPIAKDEFMKHLIKPIAYGNFIRVQYLSLKKFGKAKIISNLTIQIAQFKWKMGSYVDFQKLFQNFYHFGYMMVTRGFSEGEISMEQVFKDYLSNVNSEAKFFLMDISGYGQQVSFGDDLKSKNCFLINGMSDNVLKYISYAGKINQLDDIVSYSQELKAKQQLQESKINNQVLKPQQIETE